MNEHPQPPGWTPWPDDHGPTPFQRAVVAAVAALEAEGHAVDGDRRVHHKSCWTDRPRAATTNL